MSERVPSELACRRCRATLDAADNYCRQCGAPTANVPGAAVAFGGQEFGSAGRGPGWWESPWFVLTILFLILGPLGLPLLWKSRRFTLLWKVVLTVLTIAEAVYLVRGVYVAVQQSLTQLTKLQLL